MSIVTGLSSTGYTGSFNTTSGDYTLAGTVNTDGDKAIKSLIGTVTVTASGDKVGQFTLNFSATTSSVQDAIMAAIKAVRTAIDDDLDS